MHSTLLLIGQAPRNWTLNRLAFKTKEINETLRRTIISFYVKYVMKINEKVWNFLYQPVINVRDDFIKKKKKLFYPHDKYLLLYKLL